MNNKNKIASIYAHNYEGLVVTLEEILSNFDLYLYKGKAKKGCRFILSGRELNQDEQDRVFKSLNGGQSEAETRYEFMPFEAVKGKPWWKKVING